MTPRDPVVRDWQDDAALCVLANYRVDDPTVEAMRDHLEHALTKLITAQKALRDFADEWDEGVRLYYAQPGTTPLGFEHLGDVFRSLAKWSQRARAAALATSSLPGEEKS